MASFSHCIFQPDRVVSLGPGMPSLANKRVELVFAWLIKHLTIINTFQMVAVRKKK